MNRHIDDDLVDAARTGGTAEIEALLQAVWGDTYRLAFSILGDLEAAKDAAQESCIEIYRCIHSLRSTAAFRVWLYRIVVRSCSRLRDSKQSDLLREDGADDADVVATVDLWRALSVLPHALREAVVLRYFEDLNSKQIAHICGVPAATVRFRLAAARKRLRPLLEETSEPRLAAEVASHGSF